MIVEFSESDLLSSKVVAPAFYRVRIDEVDDKMSKDGMSTNSWLKGEILYNADNGSKEFAGVPTPFLWLINSKGLGMHAGLFKSLGMEVGVGVRVNTKALEGREIEVRIENEMYNGMMQNKMTNMYRPLREVAQQS